MSIPDRWLEYIPLKDPTKGTRIIATKTPLKEIYNNGFTRDETHKRNIDGVPLEDEFTPTQLIETLRGRSLQLGLVIDLTNTGRYYSGETFTSAGISYCKIFCPGHEIPNDDVYTNFHQKLSDFLNDQKRSQEVAVVHCTHGVNRSGYLVCRFLIDYYRFTVEEAIKKFGEGRGHEIERENYLSHLRNGCPLIVKEVSSKLHNCSNGVRNEDKNSHQQDVRLYQKSKDVFHQDDATSCSNRRKNSDFYQRDGGSLRNHVNKFSYYRNRDSYHRDRDPYYRYRDPYHRDRDPYHRDRDPYYYNPYFQHPWR